LPARLALRRRALEAFGLGQNRPAESPYRLRDRVLSARRLAEHPRAPLIH